MRKKLTIGLVLSIVLISCFVIKDPLQIFFNFLIGGIVPGLNISLGFIPSLSVALFGFWLTRLWLKSIQAQMIKRSGSLNKLENQAKEFTKRNSTEEVKRLSVVVAPEAKTT